LPPGQVLPLPRAADDCDPERHGTTGVAKWPRTSQAAAASAVRWRVISRCVVAAAVAVLAAGCTTTRVTQTQRSGIEQELLVRSVERAAARLDLSHVAGRRVALDLYALTGDQAFAKEFIAAQLTARGIEVVPDPGKSDLRLKIFATVLGVDHSETLVGTPATAVPLVGIPIPEIALFKWARNRGHSEVKIFAYDPHTDKFIAALPASAGRAKFDEYTILLAISFTRDDLEEEPAESAR